MFPRWNDLPSNPWKGAPKFMLFAGLIFFLSACSHFQNADEQGQKVANEATSEKDPKEAPKLGKTQTSLDAVLRAVPRHVLVAPITNFVWLWDKPGGSNGRAVRIKKIPSGTPAKVVEFEPEKPSAALWAEWGLKNHARQPVRWLKVTTLLGEGWVRAEFVEVH
jgi:hypothetical protein